MKLVFEVEDKPQLKQLIVFAFQQVLAIMAATIAVPMIVGNGMSTGAALFGAGVGTLVYTAFTQRKSPVFLGSSFAFIAPLTSAVAFGFLGIFLGAVWANISWGNYWSWDPKETWALITFLIYSIPFHQKIWRSLQNDKRYHLFMVLAFMSVLMTYFGVNYILGGLHSYA